MGPSQVKILFHVPNFLVGNKLHSASLTFPEFQGAGSNTCLSGEGGDAEAKEGQSGNNSAALGQGPGSSSRDTQNSIFHFTEVRPQMEDAAFFIPEKANRDQIKRKIEKLFWRRKWQPTPVFLPGESHGRNLVGYSAWGRKESDMTE